MALRDRWIAQERRWDLRFGMQCATAANFSMGKDPDKPPLEPGDFFSSLADVESEPEAMTIHEMAAVLKSAAVKRT